MKENKKADEPRMKKVRDGILERCKGRICSSKGDFEKAAEHINNAIRTLSNIEGGSDNDSVYLSSDNDSVYLNTELMECKRYSLFCKYCAARSSAEPQANELVDVKNNL